jgi:two-component system cell cycle response regulator DivK
MTTVLVVDDNPANRKLARDVLGAAGFRTLGAATGAEGIALAAEHVPDVILLDLRLPDVPGAEVVRRLRDGVRTARIPVVAMSAMPLQEHGDWLETAGFAGSLDKPIHVRTFPDQVRRFCTPGRTDHTAAPCQHPSERGPAG